MSTTLAAPRARRTHHIAIQPELTDDRQDLLQLKGQLERMLREGVWMKPASLFSMLLRGSQVWTETPLSTRDRARFTQMLADVEAAIARESGTTPL